MGRAKGSPKAPGSGRKPRFTDPAVVEALCNKYFEDCKGHPFVDPETGKAILDKFNRPIILDAKPPTVTGLALALGFSGRGDLLDYQAKPDFKEVITKAKARVEEYTETRLFDKDGANGARFSLQANFKWNEDKKDEGKFNGPVVQILCDIPRENVKIEGGENATQADGQVEVSDNADSGK